MIQRKLVPPLTLVFAMLGAHCGTPGADGSPSSGAIELADAAPSSDAAPPSMDAAVSSDAAPDGAPPPIDVWMLPDATGPCNAIPLGDAPVVMAQYVADEAPTPAGGTITPGRYILTSQIVHADVGTPPNPEQQQWVFEIHGSTLQAVAATFDPARTTRGTETMETSGSTLTLHYGCGDFLTSESWTGAYTATPQQLTIFFGSHNYQEYRLTRMP